MSRKRLFVTPYRCIDCKNCEVACSFVHTRDPRKPSLTRVRSYTLRNDVKSVVLCLQCDDAACQRVCPTGALERDPETGAINRNDKCILCKACTIACPFGNIHFDPTNVEIVKCDVCEGDPACAKYCPTGALVWAEKPIPDEKVEENVEVRTLPWAMTMPVR
ncbi:4Fe-4S dicluster domain-containing protein [bacterium]|nr:4Fe-4S dicluster domain-containing protein [bacterium]